MQTVQRDVAGRRSVAGLVVRAAAAAVCASWSAAAIPTSRSPPALPKSRPIIACGIRSRFRNPAARSNCSSAPIAANSIRRSARKCLSFGLGWKRAATGGMVVERPVGSSNEGAVAEAMREIVSILAASGMPPQSIAVQTYDASTGPSPAPVRISYPKITAQAGPCGMWPEDIGPSFNRDYFENQPPWNYGCATQRNLAAEIANPADLVQPRSETPAYNMRRATVLQKYTNGESTATAEPSSTSAAKISDVGK